MKSRPNLLDIHLIFIGTIPIVYALGSQRNFANSIVESDVGSMFAVFIGQIYPLLAAIIMFIAVYRSQYKINRSYLSVFIGLILYYLSSIFGQYFSYEPHIFSGMWTPIFLILPLLFLRSQNILSVVQILIYICRFYAYGSVLSMFLSFNWAVESNYSFSLVNALPYRLHGITSHANTLSGILIIYYAIAIFYKRIGINKLDIMFVTAVLLMTQSKTAFLIVAFMLIYRGIKVFAMRFNQKVIKYTLYSVLIVIFVVVAQNFTLDSESKDLTTTLKARKEIWQISLDYWNKNRVFGYGPDFWGTQMALDNYPIVGWLVPHAHNQFYQTLGTAGLIGLVILVVYFIQLVYMVRYRMMSKDISEILLLVLLIRGFTEVPIRNVVDSNFFYLFAILIIIASSYSDDRKRELDAIRINGRL